MCRRSGPCSVEALCPQLPSLRRRSVVLAFQVSPLLADERNLALLRLLQAEPRLGVAELARRIGMSAPAVRERLLRLEEAGVIRGWRLELEPRALGYPLTVFVRIRPMPGQLPKIAELARAMPQVAE